MRFIVGLLVVQLLVPAAVTWAAGGEGASCAACRQPVADVAPFVTVAAASGVQVAQSCRCPATTPKCVTSPIRNEYVCCASDQVGCAAPARTYCCPSGTSCNGDGSAPPYCR